MPLHFSSPEPHEVLGARWRDPDPWIVAVHEAFHEKGVPFTFQRGSKRALFDAGTSQGLVEFTELIPVDAVDALRNAWAGRDETAVLCDGGIQARQEKVRAIGQTSPFAGP